MYKGANTYNINSCETIEVFYNLRTDLDKLNYAVEATKIIRDVTEENQNCYKILQLFLNTLYTLSETDKNPELAISIFKLKLLCFLGFTPRITECTNCKQTENLQYFSLRDNGFKCEACARQDKSCLQMSESTANAIKYIVMAPAKKLYSFNLKDESLNELKLITKLYFDEKLEWKMDRWSELFEVYLDGSFLCYLVDYFDNDTHTVENCRTIFLDIFYMVIV